MLASQPLLRLCTQKVHLNTKQAINQYEILYFEIPSTSVYQIYSPSFISTYLLKAISSVFHTEAKISLTPSCSRVEFSLFSSSCRALRARITTIMHTWISLAGSQVTLTFCFLTQVFPNVTLIFTKTLLLNEDPSIHTV